MKLISIGNERDTDEDSAKAHIIDTLGDNVWRLLTEAFGGSDIYVPSNDGALHPQHALVLALGLEDAKALVEQFAGESFYVGRSSVAPCRYTESVEQGLTNRQIARKLGVSERQVRRKLAALGISNPNRESGKRLGVGTLPRAQQERRDKVCHLYLSREIASRRAAAERLGISEQYFSGILKAFQQRQIHSSRKALSPPATSSLHAFGA